MKLITLTAGVTLPAGILLSLTREQADARASQLAPEDTKKLDAAAAALTDAKKLLGALLQNPQNKGSKAVADATAKVETARGALAALRGTFRSKTGVFFKAGEQLGYDGHVGGREARTALGIEDAPAPKPAASSEVDQARAEGVKEGRRQLMAEVGAYNTALDEAEAAEAAEEKAEAALKAETDPGKRKPLEEALAVAQKATTEAAAKAESMVPKV